MHPSVAQPPLAQAHVFADAKGVAQSVTLYGGERAALALDVVIVGCGLGGLAAAFTLSKAGHHVTILESAPAIGEVGAGIQVSPNSSRLLNRWGLGPALERLAVRPEAIVLRRYATGEKLSSTPLQGMEDRYGAPYLHIHRADYHRLLFDLVTSLPEVTLRLEATVTHLDASSPRPRLTLASGEVVSADFVVGADGIKSIIRQTVIGKADAPTPTGDAAYRALIPAEQFAADPELAPFLNTPEMTGWLAPGRHLMMYPVRAGAAMNIVLLHPDNGATESWVAEGSADRMRQEFADFEPRVRKILDMVPTTLNWKLMDRAPLDSWVHPAGRVVLLGDACHPMLPYRAQGASMAIEDAALLGNLLRRLSHIDQLPALLRAYERLRLPRTAETQRDSRLNQKIFHLPDGPEQEARDKSMRAAMRAAMSYVATAGNANAWADQRKNDIQYGYDADEEAERWWREVGEREVGAIGAVGAGRRQTTASSSSSRHAPATAGGRERSRL